MTHRATAQRYVGRFAPSPTGPLHAGSLLAAVGSWLDAVHQHGDWLLRIEDIDSARSRDQWRQSFEPDLARFGLRPSREPILQSQRLDLYEQAIEQLRASNLLFRCRCTRRELSAEGEPCCLRDCRNLDLDPRESALRVDLTSLSAVTTQDRSLGVIAFDPVLHRDVVVRRRDGIISYQLAVVIDDALQGVTDVVRGADLLPSTAWQLALQQALGLPSVNYLHLPVITEADGSKLAKSRRAAPVSESDLRSALRQTLRWLRQDFSSPETTQPDELLHRAALSWDPTRFAGLTEIAIED
ncbi:MAG: tRNA glutamyl-Q(34) synthetase GluQRS [Steroidobacteraceae bacterium]